MVLIILKVNEHMRNSFNENTYYKIQYVRAPYYVVYYQLQQLNS
jgi:hypothetical protein